MKIALEMPFSERYRKGYLVTNPEKRRVIILFNSKEDRTSMSYARYLMSISLGRYLEEEEHVDHIDNDKTNDSPENLQILSQLDNNRKAMLGKGCLLSFICQICGKEFVLTKQRAYGKRNPCCSKSCSNIKKRL